MLMYIYDVINRMVITAECGEAKSYEAMLRACREVDLAIKHLSEVNNEEDLLLFDRNDATYEFMATLLDRKINFVIPGEIHDSGRNASRDGVGQSSGGNQTQEKNSASPFCQSVTRHGRVRNFSHLVVGRETLSCGNI